MFSIFPWLLSENSREIRNWKLEKEKMVFTVLIPFNSPEELAKCFSMALDDYSRDYGIITILKRQKTIDATVSFIYMHLVYKIF